MNVVPLRRYSYLDWLTIAARTDGLRMDRGLPSWSAVATGQLWRDLFEAE